MRQDIEETEKTHDADETRYSYSQVTVAERRDDE